SWFGLALSPEQDRVWWAGGGANLVHTFDLNEQKLKRTSKPGVDPAKLTAEEKAKLKEFKSGLLLDAKKGLLYSLDINKASLAVVDVKDDHKVKTAELEGRPYDLVLSHNGAQLYVSDWAGRQLLAVDTKSLRTVARIPVGEHPNQLVLHPKDDRL